MKTTKTIFLCVAMAAVAGCGQRTDTETAARAEADCETGVDRMVLREAFVAERDLADDGIADYLEFLKEDQDLITAGGAGGSREFKSHHTATARLKS